MRIKILVCNKDIDGDNEGVLCADDDDDDDGNGDVLRRRSYMFLKMFSQCFQ